jgi:hypothetical protein
MTQASVSASAVVPAPAPRVYRIIADYRQHHPHIVPPEYFTKLEVEAGGVGAGTRMRVGMRVLGVTREFVHVISEPEPGRVLQEADEGGYSTTTFIVEPARDGAAALVTIKTDFNVRSGPLGAIERMVTGSMLRRIYAKELARLEEYAATVA